MTWLTPAAPNEGGGARARRAAHTQHSMHRHTSPFHIQADGTLRVADTGFAWRQAGGAGSVEVAAKGACV